MTEEQEMLNYINEKLNDLNEKLIVTANDLTDLANSLEKVSEKRKKLLRILFEDDLEPNVVSIKDYVDGESEVCGSIGEVRNESRSI